MYKPGTFIKHKSFGQGFILQIVETKDNYLMRIDFFKKGKKYIKSNKSSDSNIKV